MEYGIIFALLFYLLCGLVMAKIHYSFLNKKRDLESSVAVFFCWWIYLPLQLLVWALKGIRWLIQWEPKKFKERRQKESSSDPS